jgi:hypothetical protein
MRNWLCLAVLLVGSTAVADEDFDLNETPHFEAQTPWYLPRDVYLGAYFHGPDTLAFRLTWEVMFAPQREDGLTLVLDAGGGWALSVPNAPDADGNPPLSSFYEHTVQVGLGYRRTAREGFYWGAQITGGPMWYGATAPGLGTEHITIGAVDARLQVGFWLGKVAVGLSGGLSQAFSTPLHSFSANYVGGAQVGFFAHWL